MLVVLCSARSSHLLAPSFQSNTTRHDTAVCVYHYSFSSAIYYCGKCGHWQSALAIFRSMLGTEPVVLRTVISYNAAISVCGQNHEPAQACRIFEEMKRERVAPSVVTFELLLRAIGRGRQWKLSLQILNEMKQHGFAAASVRAYSSVMWSLARGQQWRLALDLLREQTASIGQNGRLSHKQKTPPMALYNASMAALSKAGEWERALDLFDDMRINNLPVSASSYHYAINSCLKGSIRSHY